MLLLKIILNKDTHPEDKAPISIIICAIPYVPIIVPINDVLI